MLQSPDAMIMVHTATLVLCDAGQSNAWSAVHAHARASWCVKGQAQRTGTSGLLEAQTDMAAGACGMGVARIDKWALTVKD